MGSGWGIRVGSEYGIWGRDRWVVGKEWVGMGRA